MQKIKTIGWDMDGVLFNFAKRYAEMYTNTHPEEPVTETDIIQNWDVSKTTKYGDKLWKLPHFFSGMEAYSEMAELFRWCYCHYECYVITTAPHYVLAEKTNLMKKICPEFSDWDIFFCNRKDMVSVDILIDDAPHNAKNCKENCIVVDMPYNKGIECVARVKNAGDLYAWIRAHVEPRDFFKEEVI
ncbi:MAG: hypothetical protein RR415_06125 [Ruthenibacterium sp.]